MPDAAAQGRRLTSKLEDIARSFVGMQPAIEGAEPEQVLVFEIAFEHNDALDRLARAAGSIPGLEWLAEADLDALDLEEDGFSIRDDDEADAVPIPRRMYMLFSNQRAMDNLLGEWRRWQRDPKARAQKGVGPLKQLFIHLHDVRRWSVRDRCLDTGIETYWRDNLGDANTSVPFEIELWYRDDASKRAQARTYIAQLVHALHGTVSREACIPDIRYHALLCACPTGVITTLINALQREPDKVELLRCEDIMFFRPVGQSPCPISPDGGTRESLGAVTARPMPGGEPIVGLLDGVLVANHAALRGRIIIDDPDELEKFYQVHERQHGTAMASLIVHGDLTSGEPALERPVYVRPVMTPRRGFDSSQAVETLPPGELFVDLVHRAVRRMLDGDGDEPATAASVRIVNISLGDRARAFIRESSPLARLLDWLAWKYRLLFLISAGNHDHDISIALSRNDYETRSHQGLVATQVLQTMARERGVRRLLSPAEAINALTIGAAHIDMANASLSGRFEDLFHGYMLPSPISTVTSGLHRAVKPELLLPGGRVVHQLRYDIADRATFRILNTTRPPGQKCAAPGLRPGEIDVYVHTFGSSNATALASRHAAQIHDRLLLLRRSEPGGSQLSDALLPVLIKCLLVHGASWGNRDLLERVVERGHWQKERRQLAQFLGYGFVDRERALSSAPNRVVLINGDEIRDGQGHVYSIPLPTSLSGRKIKRRVTVTLAWFSPINPRHRKYRQARLWLRFEGGSGFNERRREADDKLSTRGTVEHCIFEEERAMAYGSDASMEIHVSCSGDAGAFKELVPYGLAVTVEVAESVAPTIYEEIRERVRPRVPVAVR